MFTIRTIRNDEGPLISRCETEIVITAESAAAQNPSLNHDNAGAVIIESL